MLTNFSGNKTTNKTNKMIPFLLAAAGGYLIAQSRKQDTFADGGTISIENRKDDLMIEQSKEISIFDEKRIGEEIIINLQKKYIKERDELIKNKVSSQELTDFIKSRISVEYLIENGVLSPVYSSYSYAFQNTPSLGRPYNYQQAIKLAEQINNINRFDRPIPFYRVLIVPSVIVNIARFTPELGDYLLYTDNEISEENLKKLGRFEDGGLLKYCWGGKMADGGMMAKGGVDCYVIQRGNGEEWVKYNKYKFGADAYKLTPSREIAVTFDSREDAKKVINEFNLEKELEADLIVVKMADGGMMAKGGEVETALSKLKKFGAKVEQVGEKGKKKWYVYNDGQWGLAEDEEGFYASDDDLIEMAEEYAGMMAKGGKIQTLIMQQNDLDPQGYTLVDYDKEKKEWYWEDYKADTYSSGFKSRKDAYEDLNEYLFKDTEYRFEGKEGTTGQKWPDLPTPTKSHSFREY